PKPPAPVQRPPQADTAQAAPAIAQAAPATGPEAAGARPARAERQAAIPVKLVSVSGKGFAAVFSSQGATLASYTLRDYLGADKQPVQLIPADGRALGCGLTVSGRPVDLQPVVFAVTGQSERSVAFSATLANGITVTKRFTALADQPGFDLEVGLRVPENVDLGSHYTIGWDCGLNSTEKDKKLDLREFAAVALMGKEYAVDKLGKLAKEQQSIDGTISFSGVRTKYFVAAIVPESGTAVSVKQGLAAGSEQITTTLSLPAAHATADRFKVYIGPIAHAMLKAVDPDLERVADTGYRWIQPISRAILWLLLAMHTAVANYGLVIIIFSVLMKLVFFPLTYQGLKSMRHMQQIQPMLKKIQDQWKNDPGRMNQETMALYKKHGVNPFAGCLPFLIQMPIFFALYSVLANTIELRQAGFAFWITDLAVKDPYYVLSILMGIAMFFQQRMNPVDPKMKAMTYMMPAMMVFIFSSLPAGLNLYWLVNNILSIGEQYVIQTRVKPLAD
ncbi:MAG TPA: membrane protein insertase YidC, partial [Candidatus Edwardsbacteria bacterium]|nr:membrane protein insertase YidC [Candidatus Edwardsbacteria bacterium]